MFRCPICFAEFDLTPEQYEMTKTQEILVRCPNYANAKLGCRFMLVVGSIMDYVGEGAECHLCYNMYSFVVVKV